MTTPNSRSPELQELLRIAVDSRVMDINVSLPGQIKSYDPGEQKADVKPLVKRILQTSSGEEIEEDLPVIPNVPVVFPRGGDFYISMPVQNDDFCLLIFNSFPIDKYKNGQGNDVSPGEFAMHELTDAVAMMGFAPFAKSIADADPNNIVLGVQNGNQMHIASDKIELGAKNASDKASLDSKIQEELSKISTELSKIQTALTTNDTHTHISAAPGSPTGIPIPLMAPSISYNPSPTNSDLVTIDS